MNVFAIPRRWTKYIMFGLCSLAFLLIVCNVYILLGTQQYIIYDTDELKPAQTVIVLGAGVNSDGELSRILKDRVDTALAVYQAGKVKRILISGDNSTIAYNEVVPAREYLLQHGVAPSNIFLDYAGFNTYDSLYRARDVFAVDSAIVVTQPFHLPRAVYIGDTLDIEIQGFPSAITDVYYRNHIREVLARVKSVLEVVINREPKFLGEVIPIEGDGRQTIE